jgi:sugar phosphate isomerase/epimerase
MKISLGSWAFSFGPYAEDPVTFEDTAKRTASAGYDGIEICGFPPHVTLGAYPDYASRRGLTDFLDRHGLGISGYAADFSEVNPTDDGNQHRYLDLFTRHVELCHDIGSPSIRVDSVAAPGSVSDREYQATFDRLAALWRKAAQIAEDHGVRMVWEFEPGFLFNKPSEILGMHQRVSHPNFKILFDTAHAYMCAVVGARQHGARDVLIGGVDELLRKLEGRIGAVHLIDNDGTLHGEETSTHRPFGQGYVDFHSLLPRLLSLHGIDWWCVDMCFWAGSWDLVECSRDFVVQLLKERTVLA